jgi:hypothetical protein
MEQILHLSIPNDERLDRIEAIIIEHLMEYDRRANLSGPGGSMRIPLGYNKYAFPVSSLRRMLGALLKPDEWSVEKEPLSR